MSEVFLTSLFFDEGSRSSHPGARATFELSGDTSTCPVTTEITILVAQEESYDATVRKAQEALSDLLAAYSDATKRAISGI